VASTLSVLDLLASARSVLGRLDPAEAHTAWRAGATLVDIRPAAQRREEGEVPGALIVERNVLEWRFDPASEARLPEAAYDLQVLVLCSEGYTSSLAAYALQQLGVRRATDVIGGFQAWKHAGLPTTHTDHVVAGVPAQGPPALSVVRVSDTGDDVGEVVVNRDHRSVHVADRELELTRMEFDLLAHLVETPHRVHTRSQLLGTLWESSWDGGTRTVDVHVHRLRSKLGSPWARSLVTVRGVGYRWVPPQR
jgi:rhodanese-related sulfurtransferase